MEPNVADLAQLRRLIQRLPGHPDLAWVSDFDLPHVVADAKSFVAESGLGERIELVGGSFLESVPTEGDAYVLKSVLHKLAG